MKLFGNKEITVRYIGSLALMAAYKGLKLVWQMGNFFTSKGEAFITRDGDIFQVKE